MKNEQPKTYHGVAVKNGSFRYESTRSRKLLTAGEWRPNMAAAVRDMPADKMGAYAQWVR